MKKLISLISALTMLAAVPMSASATISDTVDVDSIHADRVNTILEDISLYDFNSDGVTDFSDADLLCDYYAYNQTGCMETNVTDEGVTYTFLVDRERVELSDDVIQHILAAGNITNPDWNIDVRYEGIPEPFVDGIEPIDASYLRTAVAEYYGDGDVNTDGAVDALDASNVLTYYAKGQSGIYDEEYNASTDKLGAEYLGDYNADGAIDALDASNILSDYSEAQTA